MKTSRQDQEDGTWKMGVGEREASLQALEKAIRKHGGNPIRLFDRFRTDPDYTDRIGELMVQGGYLPTTSQKLARAILPNGHFFGPEDWLARLGDRVSFTKAQLAKIAEVPWSDNDLKNPGFKQPEFVFLVPPKVDGKPVALKHLQEKVFPGPNHPKFWLDWYLTGEPFAEVVVPFGWYRVVIEGVDGSENLSYSRQLTMIPEGYVNPHPMLVAMANVLFYLVNTQYLNTKYGERTSEVSKKYGRRVVVRADPDIGVVIHYVRDDAHPCIRVAASRNSLTLEN